MSAGDHKSTTLVSVIACESVYASLCKAEGAGLEDNLISAFAKAPFRFFFPPEMPEEMIRITAMDENGTGNKERKETLILKSFLKLSRWMEKHFLDKLDVGFVRIVL